MGTRIISLPLSLILAYWVCMHLYCLCCIPQFDCEWCHLVLEFVLFAAASFLHSLHSLVSLWWHAASMYMICCIQYGLVDWYRHFWRSSRTLNSEITNYLMKCGCLCCVQLARDASCYTFLGGWGEGCCYYSIVSSFASSDKWASRQAPFCILK